MHTENSVLGEACTSPIRQHRERYCPSFVSSYNVLFITKWWNEIQHGRNTSVIQHTTIETAHRAGVHSEPFQALKPEKEPSIPWLHVAGAIGKRWYPSEKSFIFSRTWVVHRHMISCCCAFTTSEYGGNLSSCRTGERGRENESRIASDSCDCNDVGIWFWNDS
jgi:hypothetical protein